MSHAEPADPGAVTLLLQRSRAGDPAAASALFERPYAELHARARAVAGGRCATLHPTALVHEAWLKLVPERTPAFADRLHFLRAAAAAIGEGGMGRVWLAEQAHQAGRVAVKVMYAGFAGGRHAERFRAEIDLLARLQHPGIRLRSSWISHSTNTQGISFQLLHPAWPSLRAAAAPAPCSRP